MNPRLRIFPLLAPLVLLSGCLSGALRGGKPDDLFRFGAADAPAPTSAGGVGLRPHTLTLLRVHFAPEIDNDRLLATQGEKTLYIKGVRWIAAAPDLFSQALDRSFQARAPEMQLLGAQSADPSGYAINISVTRFEARYQGSVTAAPTVVMEGSATVYAPKNRHIVAFRRFAVTAPVIENHATSIIAGFDAADALFTAQLVDWVRANTTTGVR